MPMPFIALTNDKIFHPVEGLGVLSVHQSCVGARDVTQVCPTFPTHASGVVQG